MLPYLKHKWVQFSLLAGLLLFAFICGALALLAIQNAGKIQKKLFPAKQAALSGAVPVEWRKIETGLLTLLRGDITLGDTVGYASGGAIDSIGNTILFVSASGHIGTVDLDGGTIGYSPVRVPMDYDRLLKDVFPQHVNFKSDWYRVQDILIKQGAHPDQAKLYVSHHVFVPETSEICGVLSQTSLNLSGGTITLADGAWEEVYRIRECVSMEEFDWRFYGLESGGKLLELDDSHLLMSVGDYGLKWELFVHDRVGPEYENDFAKIMKVSLTGGDASVYANGFRNPQGLTRDEDGRIWEAEHGPQGGDEINLVTEGSHYGWPTVSLGMNYGNYGEPRMPIPTNPVQGRHDGYEKPAMAFVPSIGISPIVALPSDPIEFKLWKNDLLAGSLREHALYHIRRDGGRLVYAEKIDLGAKLRDLHILENEWLAILANSGKSIILLREASGDTEAPAAPITISGYDAVREREQSVLAVTGATDHNQSTFRDRCSLCHAVDGESQQGPSLDGVLGREIGSLADFGYSEDLAEAKGKWTKKKLLAYIADPQAMYPGSFMPAQNLNEYEKEQLIRFLSSTE